jgi:hypothetical protein
LQAILEALKDKPQNEVQNFLRNLMEQSQVAQTAVPVVPDVSVPPDVSAVVPSDSVTINLPTQTSGATSEDVPMSEGLVSVASLGGILHSNVSAPVSAPVLSPSPTPSVTSNPTTEASSGDSEPMDVSEDSADGEKSRA